MIIIRDAAIEDAEKLLEIYDYYVKNTAISFEYDTPSLKEFQSRMEKLMGIYPYLVILKDGKIVGYAYASPFVGRAAYGYSCELTIYLDNEKKNSGFGKLLYQELEKILSRMGIKNLYACIGYPETEDEYLTTNSADFHAHLGFKKVGEFRFCGCKFQRWYHMIWMEKIIGDHDKIGKDWKKYSEIKQENHRRR